MDSSDYKELFTDEFNSHFKKAAKHYRHSFENDFGVLLKVIQAKKELSPQTEQINGLGKDIILPVYKIRMQIKEAQQKNGRVVFLLDHKNKTLVFLDVYLKVHQANHDVNVIKNGCYGYFKEITKSTEKNLNI